MQDVSSIDTSTTLFGRNYPVPFGLAPSAMQKLAGGEGPRESVPLIKRAEAAGYEALVLTVDTPVLRNRINERKTPLVLPPGLHLSNLSPPPHSSQTERKPTANRLLMDARTGKKLTPSSSRRVAMKIILKGIMTPEDALLAVEHGADAIVVSNHGGRQLDEVCSTLEALPAIHSALATNVSERGKRNSIPVIFDGGVRHGADVLEALAMGADFVLLGRPVLWGLGYKGQEGVESVIHILERELTKTMALTGVAEVEGIGKEYIGVKDTSMGGFGVSKL
ncbi:related to L-lactate dehydrogenase (cytochrome) [Phialocephala subalpina]|uniref:Related to L-lactate dehydrogenase (Cytochrome) n=1 Tax=Phialocephala subalpina TaxID=576137 RepID=A0A1L7XNF8_9HELO|nr:related to L-lactate dehydrogenase (cytochrome) [Phialocephala subalpina]